MPPGRRSPAECPQRPARSPHPTGQISGWPPASWLRVPPVSVLIELLRNRGLDVSNEVLTVDDAVQAILEGGQHVK